MYELDFVHYNLGHLEEGTTVAVFLQSAANVCILTSTNFTHYKLGYSFNYLGGYITHSPYYAVIPRGGYWHVVIDLGGYEGYVSSRVEIIPPEKTEVELTFMGYPAMKYPKKRSQTNLPTTCLLEPTVCQMDLDTVMRLFKIQLGILYFLENQALKTLLSGTKVYVHNS